MSSAQTTWMGQQIGWREGSHNSVDIVLRAPEAGAEVDPEAFQRELRQGVQQWRAEGRNAVWLKLNVDQMHLCRAAHDEGLQLHNAKGSQADMFMWLNEDVPNKVPPFGFHQVGVGAFVLNAKNELLLVKERHRRMDRWKMPGGLVDPGETLAEGARREVLEETGVDAKFHSTLAFWQRTLDANQSDLYFVCRLSVDEAEIHFDPHEIAECQWMPLREYVEHHSHPMLLAVLRKNFGISEAGHLDALAEAPLAPNVELSLTSLRVAPTVPPFETFFVRQRETPWAEDVKAASTGGAE